MATMLRGWTIGGVLNATSGTPFTATVNGDTSGTGYTGNARAEATGLPVTTGSGFFNPRRSRFPRPELSAMPGATPFPAFRSSR